MNEGVRDEPRGLWLRPFGVVAAAIGWATLGLQFFLSMRVSLDRGKGFVDGLITYFSYFTILTNALVSLALTAPLLPSRSRAVMLFTRPAVNTAIAASIAMVGITYIALLQRLWHPQGLQLVADTLLHHLMPVLFMAYWWVAVPADELRWGDVLRWAFYPIFYFMYAMIRGALSADYPYPFIDADAVGYRRALGNAGIILLGFIAISLLLVALGRLKGTAGIVKAPPTRGRAP
jgi:hypothetical protein